MKRKLSYTTNILLLAIGCLCAVSCSKLVEVSAPVTSINEDNVYTTDATASAVLNGIYTQMIDKGLPSGNSLSAFMSLWSGLSADEFRIINISDVPQMAVYYRNALLNTSSPFLWNYVYTPIYTLNAAIAALPAADKLTPAVQHKLLGEAKFMRGFFYFYLMNLYGPVPLVLTTDYTKNSLLPRSSTDSVTAQVIADLTDAESLLSEDYLEINGQTIADVRVVPVKWAAKAMLARVYLYKKDYANAITKATEVIEHAGLFHLEEPDNVFLKTSHEAIWQLQPVGGGGDTPDGWAFIIPSTGFSGDHPVALSSFLLDAFESGDQRRSSWVGTFIDKTVTPNVSYYYPHKYKLNSFSTDPDYKASEYQMVLRLAEQYLIRAEARAIQGDLTGSAKDIDSIRIRAGLPATTAATKDALIDAVMKERRIEFFAEWGHRWLDLKRTGTVDAVMSVVTPQKGGVWSSNWQWYPLSQTELQYGPHLKQNAGY